MYRPGPWMRFACTLSCLTVPFPVVETSLGKERTYLDKLVLLDAHLHVIWTSYPRPLWPSFFDSVLSLAKLCGRSATVSLARIPATPRLEKIIRPSTTKRHRPQHNEHMSSPTRSLQLLTPHFIHPATLATRIAAKSL